MMRRVFRSAEYILDHHDLVYVCSESWGSLHNRSSGSSGWAAKDEQVRASQGVCRSAVRAHLHEEADSSRKSTTRSWTAETQNELPRWPLTSSSNRPNRTSLADFHLRPDHQRGGSRTTQLCRDPPVRSFRVTLADVTSTSRLRCLSLHWISLKRILMNLFFKWI